MANPWFRLYHEWDSDAKVQSMPDAMQCRLVKLMCSQCRGETLHETERAFHWRISDAELSETKALFIAKGFMDDEWNLLNWNKRQFLSDSSTDRVRRYRQGMKQDETLPKRQGNVTVTAPDTDTDSEADAEQRKKVPSADAEYIYSRYPRKVGKGAAIKAIGSALKRICDGELGEKMPMEGAVRYLSEYTCMYADSEAGNRGTFTPHPATWFNQKRYMDNPEEWQKGEQYGTRNYPGKSQSTINAATELIAEIEAGYAADEAQHPPAGEAGEARSGSLCGRLALVSPR